MSDGGEAVEISSLFSPSNVRTSYSPGSPSVSSKPTSFFALVLRSSFLEARTAWTHSTQLSSSSNATHAVTTGYPSSTHAAISSSSSSRSFSDCSIFCLMTAGL